jgi:heme/copper-type cytochrome/quinol oxidase subunit 3
MALPAPLSSLAWQAGRVAQSAGRTAAIYAAMALVGLTGAGFLVAAAFIWLASLTDALIASLILAAFFLAVAGIWLAILMTRRERVKQERRSSAANTALLASSLSIADAGLRIISRSKGPMFWPAAATLFAAWYITRSKERDD